MRKFIKSNPILFAISVVLIGFFYLKIKNLNNFYSYKGKIVGLEKISSNSSTIGKSRGNYTIVRDIPRVEFYRGKDTISYEQGELRLFTNFKINEEVTVLVDKRNKYKTYIFSLFYYWVDYYELVLMLFVFLFIFGFIRNFV